MSKRYSLPADPTRLGRASDIRRSLVASALATQLPRLQKCADLPLILNRGQGIPVAQGSEPYCLCNSKQLNGVEE